MTPSQSILRYFEYGHLPAGPLRDTSEEVSKVAHFMEMTLPAGPEKTTGLRKLLEAKDCFVRAALDIAPPKGVKRCAVSAALTVHRPHDWAEEDDQGHRVIGHWRCEGIPA